MALQMSAFIPYPFPIVVNPQTATFPLQESLSHHGTGHYDYLSYYMDSISLHTMTNCTKMQGKTIA